MKVGRYRRNRRHDHELRVSRLLNLVLVVLGLARVVRDLPVRRVGLPHTDRWQTSYPG